MYDFIYSCAPLFAYNSSRLDEVEPARILSAATDDIYELGTESCNLYGCYVHAQQVYAPLLYKLCFLNTIQYSSSAYNQREFGAVMFGYCSTGTQRKVFFVGTHLFEYLFDKGNPENNLQVCWFAFDFQEYTSNKSREAV